MGLVSTTVPASCGHLQTGSSRVFLEGLGLTRQVQDSAGGIIIGPGSARVWVEYTRASLVGDRIWDHGTGTHNNARTRTGQSRVFAS
jgi:hypothetical protein